MPISYAQKAYLQAQVQQEVDPKRLILFLYEEALKQIRLTKEGIQENDLRKRGEHLSRVIMIVSTLYDSLDRKFEDEAITFLQGLYKAMLVELGKVSITADMKTLDLSYKYLERLKEIWERDVMHQKNHAGKEVLVHG